MSYSGDFEVEQSPELLPRSTTKQLRRRRVAEAIWRPLVLLTWLTQAFLIRLLIRGVREAHADDHVLVQIFFICWQAVLLGIDADSNKAQTWLTHWL